MSAWAACRLIEERAGIETVLHFPTRGRNLVRLQGDLLGARALGIRNLFVCVGDPVTIGDYPQALERRRRDRHGPAAARSTGRSTKAPTGRVPRSVRRPPSSPARRSSPLAPDLEREVRLVQRKVGCRRAVPAVPAPVRARSTASRCERRTSGRPAARSRSRSWRGYCRSPRRATPRSCTTRSRGSRSPTLVRDRLAAAGEDGWAEGRAAAIEVVGALRERGCGRDLPDAGVRTLRPGRRGDRRGPGRLTPLSCLQIWHDGTRPHRPHFTRHRRVRTRRSTPADLRGRADGGSGDRRGPRADPPRHPARPPGRDHDLREGGAAPALRG